MQSSMMHPLPHRQSRRKICRAVESLEARTLLSSYTVSPLTGPSEPGSWLSVGSNVYFDTQNAVYKTDGTSAGTTALTASQSYPPSTPVNAQGTIYWAQFNQGDGSHTLWKTDGTPGGTTSVGSLPTSWITPLNNEVVYFDSQLNQFRGSDGTILASFPYGCRISATASTGSKVFFSESSPSTFGGPDGPTHLWVTDGTAKGTKDFDQIGVADASVGLTTSGNNVYAGTSSGFYETDGNIFFTDAAPLGVLPIPNTVRSLNGIVTFLEAGNFTLWATTGTGGYAKQVSSTSANTERTMVPAIVGSSIFYASGTNLLVTDLTTGVTNQLTSFPNGGGVVEPTLYAWNGEVYFISDSTNQPSLWKSDGTVAGTVMLKTVGEGYIGDYDLGAYPYFAPAGNHLLFAGYDIVHDVEPWVTDGTTAGTMLLKDLNTTPTTDAEITGTVFNDVNGNGTQDSGEAGLTTAQVFIDTNGDGKYEFPEPASDTTPSSVTGSGQFLLQYPGGASNVKVYQIPPAGFHQASPSGSYVSISVLPGQIATGVNFGDRPIAASGSISGTVYVDNNGNGTRDSGESALANVTVFLDTNNNGARDSGEPSTTTATDGSYHFTGLKDASYAVQAVTPASYVSQKSKVVAISGGSNATASFGFYKYATVSGVVFFDKNANGIQDAGEPGLSNLFAEAGVDLNLPFAIFSVTFGANGAFTIGRIPPSTVPIEASLYPLPKPAWHATTPDPVNITVHSGQAYTGLKFGFAPNDPKTGTIVATAFTDTNGNGVFDSGESTYTPGGVFLDLNRNGKLDTGEPSDSRGGGEVVTSGLPPGSYQVRDVPPAGYHVTTPLPHVVTVTANGLAYVYIGLAKGTPPPPGSITGSVFQDKNGNGKQDSGEAGLVGWTVYDDVNNDLKLDTGDIQTLTNSSGKYTLAGVPTGTANVRIVLKSGWVKTNNPAAAVTVNSGATASGPSFGVNVANAGTISGVVFDDANADGIRQHAEIGLGGFTIYIDSNKNGKLDTSDPSAATDINGNFTISGVAPGTYVLHQVPNGAWFLVGSATVSVTVKANQTTSVLMAETKLGGIKGTVYNDLNANTYLDTGEPPLAGVRVFLDLNKNGVLDAGEPSTLSDASGAYQFTGLRFGTYRVAQQAPLKGMAFLSPVNGHIDITPYGGDVVGGITLGQVKLTTPVTFSGTVFKDLNLDGKQETGEAGLSGWKFYVDYNNNSALDAGEPTAISNSAGLFTFNNIPTGRYLVRPIVPAGWRMDWFVAWFANSDGKNVTNLNFAASQTAWIGGRVFDDYDGNGILGYDDVALSGWTLYIDANSNGKLDAGEKSFTTAANGNYNFNGLAPGTYTVRIVPQAGFKLTTVGSFTVTVKAGQSVTQNFGVQATT